MPVWQWLLDLVGLVLLLALLYGIALIVRRRFLARHGGTFELSCRLRTDRPGRGWLLGLGRYSGDSLEWFRIFSLSPRPRMSWSRQQMTYSGRRDLVGAIPGPFEAWLTLRGLRTLHLRVERAQSNAEELVRRLGEHPALSEVRYPGFGGIVSVVLAQGEVAADLLSRKTRLWVHATSLGGVESTLERRRRWKAEAATIPEGLVRLSVGVEDVEDLWDDLRDALDGCVG